MFDSFKEAIRARVQPTSAHLASLRGDLRNRLRYFRSHRNAAEQTELAQDFVQVLRAWGIEDAEHIPAVLRELRLRLLIFALPVLACGIAVMVNGSGVAWLALLLVALPCAFGMLTTCWRLSVLSRCRFQPFNTWLGRCLCSLVGLAQERP